MQYMYEVVNLCVYNLTGSSSPDAIVRFRRRSELRGVRNSTSKHSLVVCWQQQRFQSCMASTCAALLRVLQRFCTQITRF